MRGDVLARRDQWQATPRAADLAMEGLSEVEQRQAHSFERLALRSSPAARASASVFTSELAHEERFGRRMLGKPYGTLRPFRSLKPSSQRDAPGHVPREERRDNLLETGRSSVEMRIGSHPDVRSLFSQR